MSRKRDRNQQQGESYLKAAFGGLIVVAIVQYFWPQVLPFKLGDFWHSKGSVLDWLGTAWPLLAWGAGLATVFSVLTRNSREANQHAEAYFVHDFVLSVWAGVMEEICFRWLIFLNAIVAMKLSNFLFFGFLGFGIPEFFQVHLVGPIANFFTLHGLQQYLNDPSMWAVGGAIITANAFFRDGHKYQGLFGWLNSWFCGMFLFYLLFTHGLLACILVHFLYDALIDVIRYADRAIERSGERA